MSNFYYIASCLSLFIIFSTSFFSFVEAQLTPITISDSMENVIFDGKWTFMQEWKGSALETLQTDNGHIWIRTAHQGDFVYVMLDADWDITPSNDDFAVVCFDSRVHDDSNNNDKSYCFKIGVNSDKPDTLLWNEEKSKFEITNNHPNLISIGGVSDENDRYTPIPHSSYEFKIPLEMLNRYDIYGFFVGVFNSDNTKTYTWPEIESVDLSSEIPPPQSWGQLFSPDKSIPEYDLPILILIFTISFVILFSTKRSSLKILVDSK